MNRKQAILSAATRLFAEYGFTHTTMAEIARFAQVAEGTVFYHFHSKEDLFLAILKELKETILSEFAAYRLGRAASGLDQVEQALAFYLDVAGKLEDSIFLLHRNYLYRLARVNKTFTEPLQEIYDCLVNIFESAIAAGQVDGSIVCPSARKSALLLFILVDGLVRFKNLHLYDPATLHGELMAACRRMLQAKPWEE